MNIRKFSININDVAGIGTWMLVFGISLYWLQKAPNIYSDHILLICLLFVVYLFCFVLVTRKPSVIEKSITILIILMLQLFSSFALMWYLPLSFLPILTIIWVSILPFHFSIRNSILIMLTVVISWFSLYAYRWNVDVYFSALLYGSFHFFSIFMMYNLQIAEQASAETQRLNTELLATRQLLAEVSRQTERTRIARDLHDLLGHHLTALIINLQVAGHLTDGEAKSKVEQCYSLAKLLLSDVREAVTTLRENQSLDFQKMVSLMVENIPRIEFTTNIDAQLDLENIELAKSLLSCIQEAITNSLRHSGANKFWISLKEVDQHLQMELVDNGQVQGKVVKGNGLRGMMERVEAINGELHLDNIQNSLRINISIPISETNNGHSKYSGQLL